MEARGRGLGEAYAAWKQQGRGQPQADASVVALEKKLDVAGAVAPRRAAGLAEHDRADPPTTPDVDPLCISPHGSPMSVTVQFDLPESVFSSIRSTPEAFVSELRLAAAVKWFESGRISQGKAAEVAGVSRQAFHDALSRYGVSAFQISPDDLRDELRTL